MPGPSKATERFSFLLSPAGFVVGNVLSLFAAAAGVQAFPSSGILMGLFFVLLGAFFIVTIPVLVMASLFITTAICRAVLGLGHRCPTGSDEDAESEHLSEASLVQKDERPHAPDADLWDRWIDGV
jgi:hypothetical protein